MKLLITIPVGAICLFLTGCCMTSAVLSGNGNVGTGDVGGKLKITACSPMQKEVANQLRLLSDWYRVQWQDCGTKPDASKCRTELTSSYTTQKQTLLEFLEKMKQAPSETEQAKIYDQMLREMKPQLFPR